MKIYTGIVDAHGLESFQECQEIGVCSDFLTLRASANRHRHAMVYWVELSDEKAKAMRDAIKQAQKDGDFHIPLLLLKSSDFVDKVAFEKSMKSSWDMIPNDRLDPYWSD